MDVPIAGCHLPGCLPHYSGGCNHTYLGLGQVYFQPYPQHHEEELDSSFLQRAAGPSPTGVKTPAACTGTGHSEGSRPRQADPGLKRRRLIPPFQTNYYVMVGPHQGTSYDLDPQARDQQNFAAQP